MAKTLLLWSVTLVLAGSAVLAQPRPTAPQLFAVEQLESAPAPQCLAQEPDLLAGLKTKLVPFCQGDGCSKTSDCRPPSLPECANCWCVGPAGDKSCACF